MEYKDYYQTLGVPRTASQADIKKAFRKLARQHHPDRNAGDKAAERRFKDLNEANAVLSDPQKRTLYDQLGANWEAVSRAGAAAGRGAGNPFGSGSGPFGAAGPFGPAGRSGNVRYEFRTSGDAGGFSDFFRTFFAGAEAGASAAGAGPARGRTGTATRTAGGSPTFEDILAELGLDGATVVGGRGATPQTLAALEAEAELSLEEAYHGTSRRLDVDGRRLEVTVPRGVATGSRIRLTGKGPDGRDIVVVTRVRPHPVFTRRGADLERELRVTLQEALLGTQVPVATLGGNGLLTIPAGTQTGRTFRLGGRGMPKLNAAGNGDLFVKVRVVLPTDLTEEARAAAAAFFALVDQPDPRAG